MANTLADQYRITWKTYKTNTYYSETPNNSTGIQITDASSYLTISASPRTGTAGVNSVRDSIQLYPQGSFPKSGGGTYENAILMAAGSLASVVGQTAYVGQGNSLLQVVVTSLPPTSGDENTVYEYTYRVTGEVVLNTNPKTIYAHESKTNVGYQTYDLRQGPVGYENFLKDNRKIGDSYTGQGEVTYEIFKLEESLSAGDTPVEVAPEPPVLSTPPTEKLNDGAYVKFTVTLGKQELCSQIMLSLFTKYPMEIVSIYYEEDTDTWHEPQELMRYTDEVQSAGMIRVTFPSILAKRFTFIINQKNYEKNVYSISKRAFDEKDLWEKIAIKEVETTLDLGDGLETVAKSDLDNLTGWGIYLDALEKHKTELHAWEKEMDAYNTEYANYLVKLSNY